MFEFELVDSSLFKISFDSISRIVDEVMCFVDKDGFRVSAMDKSHTTFIVLNLNPDLFDKFDYDVPMKFAVDTSELFKVLKRGGKKDKLKFKVNDNTLNIIFEGEVIKNFGIRLIDLEYEEVKIPNFDGDCVIDVGSDFIKNCLTDVYIYTEKICFCVDDNMLHMKGEGQLGEVDIEYDTCINFGKKYISFFNIDKLKDIFVASKFSDCVELGLGEDVPVNIKFLLPSEDGYLNFILAPIIEYDEE